MILKWLTKSQKCTVYWYREMWIQKKTSGRAAPMGLWLRGSTVLANKSRIWFSEHALGDP